MHCKSIEVNNHVKCSTYNTQNIMYSASISLCSFNDKEYQNINSGLITIYIHLVYVKSSQGSTMRAMTEIQAVPRTVTTERIQTVSLNGDLCVYCEVMMTISPSWHPTHSCLLTTAQHTGWLSSLSKFTV